MAQTVEEVSGQMGEMLKQFAGLQQMLKSTMDSLEAIGTWQSTADQAFEDLRKRAQSSANTMDAMTRRMDLAATRVDAIEARLTRPTDPPPIHPSQVLGNFDLNTAPKVFSGSSSMDGERAKVLGDDCGGVLGPRPQYDNKGKQTAPEIIPLDDTVHTNFRPPPFPKLEFSKFDGEFPRAWRDECEMFFEVYAVHSSLKTRMAALNFQGVAKTWLQTVQRLGRILDWDQLCDMVMQRFDKNQYQTLLKKFEALKQSGSVEEYQGKAAVEKRRTMKICGKIGKLDVLILINSGSVGTFISDQLASRLPDQRTSCQSVKFVAADGSPMICQEKIEKLQWHAQGHSFTSSVGILPLKCFDMILGQDWLESCSPMWVHWAKKLMKFTYQGCRVSLQGIKSDGVKCSNISAEKMQGLLSRRACTHLVQLKFHAKQAVLASNNTVLAVQEAQIPPEIQQLLEAYSDLFQTPTQMPPPRPFDHRIQQLPGSQPVNIRPYRQSPIQKD